MPVERSESRRASRKSTVNDEDVEVKRARGEISCAECRRLKLKCDKKIPCGSCVRRGCTTICPNGSLSAGQGTRFVLADTEQLHRKISEMSERIRQLEDSIALFQAGVSNERHPLLRDDLLTIKFGPEVRRTVDEEHTRETLAQSIDALGTLTVGDHGETKYYGRMGASESLFLVNIPLDADSDSDDRDDISLPNELKNLDLTFPLAIVEDGYDSIMDQLEDQLPPQPRAWALCEAYIAHITWWHRPMKRDEIIDDILIPIYNSVKDESSRGRAGYRPSSPESRRCPHRLAVLFLVLATGALVDLTLPPCSPEAEKYYRLGRAALSLRSILDSPEIETVEAVALMAGYHSVCTRRYSVESAWTLASTAMKLAQSIGLHRDSRQWELSEKSVQRRRNMFWEMFMFETLHCIALGRPPSMTLSQIDCEFPCDDEEEVAENGDTMQGYSHFKLTFFKDIYFPIAEAMLSAKAPSYATVLDLDRRIRQMTLPPVKLYLRPDDDDYNNPALCMKSYMLSHFRSLTMIHIHKTYFAQALLENPTSPLSSPYAPSFLAANRCASILLKSFVHHHERCGELCGRFWSMWTHAFSAAVIIGATISRLPHSSLAPSGLVELDLAVSVFQKGASQSLRARQGLPYLLKLKERANEAFRLYRDKRTNPSGDFKLQPPEEYYYKDALAIFGGQTRILPTKSKFKSRMQRTSQRSPSLPQSQSSPRESSSSSQHAPSPPSSSSSCQVSTPSDSEATSTPPELHPSLMMYLSQVPSQPPLQTGDMTQLGLEQMIQACPPPVMEHMSMPLPVPPQLDEQLPHTDLDFLGSLLGNPQYQPPPTFGQDVNMQMVSGGFDVPPFANGDVIMSDQWMSLMHETGMLDGVDHFSQETGFPSEMFNF